MPPYSANFLATLDDGTTVVHMPHVCIIESPSPADILDGRREGSALAEALTLAEIRNAYFPVSDSQTLQTAFKRICDFSHPRELSPSIPVEGRFISTPQLFLHFSCHGNDQGIGLTNGDFLYWAELGQALLELGTKLDLFRPDIAAPVCMIGISMSACCGFHAYKMATDPIACPFACIVGTETEVNWTDSLTGFVTFYHNLIHKRRTLPRAVRAMNQAAALRNVFKCITSAETGAQGVEQTTWVAIMAANSEGRFRWVYDKKDGHPDKPWLTHKDQVIDQQMGFPFRYFDEPDEAMAYMRANPDEQCQIEYGAARDIELYLEQPNYAAN